MEVLKTIKVFYPPYSPAVSMTCANFPNLHVTEYCQYPGLLVEIINAIANEANLEILPLTDYSFGRTFYNNIPTTEAQTMILNGTIDIIALGFQKTEVREEKFAFSEPLYSVKTRLLHRNMDGIMEELFSLFRPYDSTIWTSFVVMWILQWLFCVLAQRLENGELREKQTSLLDSAWSIMRIQLLQPDKLPVKSTFGRLSVYIYSIFQCTILLALFSSFILASIIKPSPEIEDPIRKMVDRVRSGQNYLITNDPRGWFYEKVNTSRDDLFTKIRHALKINKLQFVDDREKVLWLVAHDNALLFQQADEWSFYRAMAYCDKYMPPVDAYFMLRKDNPLIDRINKAIKNLKIKLTGISWKYYELAKKQNKCPPRRGPRPLQLTPFVGLIIVCASIFGIAFLILILEVICYSICQRINKKLKILIRKGISQF